jgi:hypothetical protein
MRTRRSRAETYSHEGCETGGVSEEITELLKQDRPWKKGLGVYKV